MDQPWQEVKVGTRFPKTAVIQTAAKSRADICLGRSPKRVKSVLVEHPSGRIVGHTTLYDNMIRLWENSVVRFERLAQGHSEGGTRPADDVRLDLSAGRMAGWVPKLAEGSRYEIRFPNGVARILGTVYEVSVDGWIKVYEGSISFTYLDSQKAQLIMSKQQFDVRTGVLCAISEDW